MSSDFLCDVVMPAPEPELERFTEPQQEEISESVPPSGAEMNEETGEENPNFIYSDDDEDPIPEPVKKSKIPQDQIFAAPKVKSILDPESMKDPIIPLKKPKQVRKKRGPASAEQLERLARGREKAKETMALKKQMKAQKLATDREDKELVEAVREKERKKMRKKLEDPLEDTAVKIIEKPIIVEKGYSQQDLDDAVARAVDQSVQKVEILRKQRKEVKKKEQAKQKHDAQVFHEINKAIKPTGWDACFL